MQPTNAKLAGRTAQNGPTDQAAECEYLRQPGCNFYEIALANTLQKFKLLLAGIS